MTVYCKYRGKQIGSVFHGVTDRNEERSKILKFVHIFLLYIGLAGLFFAFAVNVWGANASSGTVAAAFQPFETMLDRYLSEKSLENDGLVSAFDYQAALDDPETQRILDAQAQHLAGFDISALDNRKKAIAFWNNAYNFFMIYQILSEPEGGRIVGSVWDYGGRYSPFHSNVFERKRFTIGGTNYSLDDMEKGMLLGEEFQARGWKDARVHFTVNCAAVGCPPLRADIYTEDNIDALMTENARRAFNTPRHLRMEGNTLYVTELFKWYKADFVEAQGSIKDFIRAYADDAVIDRVNTATRIRYIEYDWSLNRPENFPEFQ